MDGIDAFVSRCRMWRGFPGCTVHKGGVSRVAGGHSGGNGADVDEADEVEVVVG